METVLVTSLSRENCMRRLETVTRTWGFPSGKLPACGSIGKRSFRLRKNIYPARNSFQEHLYGRMDDASAGGTRIACRTGMATGVKIFNAAVFAATALVGLIGLAALLERIASGRPVGEAVLLVLGSTLGMFWTGMMTLVARSFGSLDSMFLIDLVMETLEARPEAAPPAS